MSLLSLPTGPAARAATPSPLRTADPGFLSRALNRPAARRLAAAAVLAFAVYSLARVGSHASKNLLGDWGVYYRAGIAMRHDRPIYTVDEGPMLTFKNAPVVAVLAESLSAVPLVPARVLSLAIDLALLAALMAAALRLVDLDPRDQWLRGWIALAAYVLVLPYVLLQLYTGQTTVLFVALTVFAFHLAVRDRPWAAGLAIAGAICLKLVPVCVVPYFLYNKRPVAALAATALGLAVLLAVPAVWVGWDANAALLAGWPAHLRDTEIPSQVWRLQNQSVLAELARLLSPTAYHVNVESWEIGRVRSVWLATGLAAAALLYAFVHRTRRDPSARAAHLALLLIYMTVFNPLAWRYNFLALAVPYAVVLATLRRSPRDRLTWAFLAASAALTFTPYHAQVYGARLAGALSLAAAVVVSRRRPAEVGPSLERVPPLRSGPSCAVEA